MPAVIAYVLGILAAIAGTVLAFIFIVPDKKRAGLNKFFQWVHDVCNFKSLLIEKILKALYIFSTLFVMVAGFFLLFSVQYYGWYGSQYMGLTGVIMLILGPIVLRLVYEGIMLAVLQVKNTIEINNKLIPQEGSVADKQSKEAAKKAEEEAKLAEQRAAQMAYQQQYQQQAQYQQPQYGQPVQPQYTQPVQPAQPVQSQPYVQPVQYPDQNDQQ